MITSVDCKAETQQKQPKQIISKTKWITVKTVVKKKKVAKLHFAVKEEILTI